MASDLIPSTAIDADANAWQPWTPAELVQVLRGVTVPWAVAGGWAIDLFLGFESRAHSDIEISVPATRFLEFAGALSEYEFYVVKNGLAWPVIGAEETLANSHQTWVREPSIGIWRMDIFRESLADELWVYRRYPNIRRPYEEIIKFSADGIPHLSPEIILLFKAKYMLPKDEADFSRVVPLLDDRARQWLAGALQMEYREHPWIRPLVDAELVE